MTVLEQKIEILKAVMQVEVRTPQKLYDAIVRNRGLDLNKVDDAIQVEPIIIAKIVNFLHKELSK